MDATNWRYLASILLVCLFSSGLCTRVCYDPFDCFTDDPPFTSPVRGVRFLPQRRDVINVTYSMYVRHESPYERNNDFQSVNGSGPHVQSYRMKLGDVWRELLMTTKPTKIIIHDYDDTVTNSWIFAMTEQLLIREDCHVITVSWKSLARRFRFEQAMANARLVGAEITYLLQNIRREKPAFDLGSVHIIGHGIGAHIASYVGKNFKVTDDVCVAERDDAGSWWDPSSWIGGSQSKKKCPKLPEIGQITGLDPFGQWYETSDVTARLDSNDAKFVDVVHSDVTEKTESAVGRGIKLESGHVDIYPNGGFKQPGCERGFTGLERLRYVQSEGPRRLSNCNHMRSITYYLSSMDPNSCPMTSYPCSRWHDFVDGKCTSCIEQGDQSEGNFISGILSYVGISHNSGHSRRCLQIGPSSLEYWRQHVEAAESEDEAPRNVKAYMRTTAASPYCVNYVRVELELEEAWSEGVLSFRFTNQANQRTGLIKVGRVSNWGSTTNPSYLVTLPHDYRNITGVSVLWELGVTRSWWPDRTSGEKATRKELRIPITKVTLSEPPSNEKFDYCTTRRSLRSRKEIRFTSC